MALMFVEYVVFAMLWLQFCSFIVCMTSNCAAFIFLQCIITLITLLLLNVYIPYVLGFNYRVVYKKSGIFNYSRDHNKSIKSTGQY